MSDASTSRHFPTFSRARARLRTIPWPRDAARRRAVERIALVLILLIALMMVVRLRASQFARLAAEHDAEFIRLQEDGTGYFSGHEGDRVRYWHRNGSAYTEQELDLLEWHGRLRMKYRDAARRPWLPLRPDPPRPGGSVSRL